MKLDEVEWRIAGFHALRLQRPLTSFEIEELDELYRVERELKLGPPPEEPPSEEG